MFRAFYFYTLLVSEEFTYEKIEGNSNYTDKKFELFVIWHYDWIVNYYKYITLQIALLFARKFRWADLLSTLE